MQCYKCKRDIPDYSLVCSYCGAEMSEKSKRGFASGGTTAPQMQYTPMGWFKFLIYFMLFADAISAIASAYSFITGDIYTILYAGEYSAVQAYADYGVGLRIADILNAAGFIIFAVLAIVCRYRLVKFKKDGPVYFYLSYTLSVVFALAYSVAENIIIGIDYQMLASSLFSVVPQLIFVYLNYIYFKKRKHLFVN